MAFTNLFKNLYAQGFGGQNAMVDPNAWNDLQAANFMDYGVEPGNYPGVGEQLKLGADNLGNSAAQNTGLLNFGFGAAKGLFDTYNTFKQNNAMQDMLNFQKQQYNTNLAMTRKQTNMELSDRQRRRVSANPNAESVESYMGKWGV